MSELTSRVSSKAVREATGRDWDDWLAALDAAGAADMSHKEIVAHLEGEVESSWWRQSIADGYEQARGKREVGQTADAGFQVGVQRSVAASAAEVWELLTTRPELWLGDGAAPKLEKGERYEAGGASGEIRVVRPGDRLRLTWRPDGWDRPATLQLTLLERSGKTVVNVHLEKLPDAEAREEMRTQWRARLERMVEAIRRGS